MTLSHSKLLLTAASIRECHNWLTRRLHWTKALQQLVGLRLGQHRRPLICTRRAHGQTLNGDRNAGVGIRRHFLTSRSLWGRWSRLKVLALKFLQTGRLCTVFLLFVQRYQNYLAFFVIRILWKCSLKLFLQKKMFWNFFHDVNIFKLI